MDDAEPAESLRFPDAAAFASSLFTLPDVSNEPSLVLDAAESAEFFRGFAPPPPPLNNSWLCKLPESKSPVAPVAA
jgi:hypothetical protein